MPLYRLPLSYVQRMFAVEACSGIPRFAGGCKQGVDGTTPAGRWD